MIERAGMKDEQRMIGRGREAVRDAPVADAAGNAEDGRAERNCAVAGSIALKLEADQLIVTAGVLTDKEVLVAVPLQPGR